MAGHGWFSISLTAWVSMLRLGVHGDEETQAKSSTYPGSEGCGPSQMQLSSQVCLYM